MPSFITQKIKTALALRYRLGTRNLARFAMNRMLVWLLNDPTCLPPPGYTRWRADAVYGEAFRRCFEYLEGTRIQGSILEFGTLRGYTARLIAGLIREFGYPGMLYLYDSFEGLPEIDSSVDRHSYEVAISKVWFRGQMAVEQDMHLHIERALSKLMPSSQLKVVKGYYKDTLDSSLPETKAALVHVDCDLYASAKYVLEKLLSKDLLQDGCVLMFDDFNANRANPFMGERRALVEAFTDQDRLDYSLFFAYGYHGQAFFVHDREAIRTIGTRAHA